MSKQDIYVFFLCLIVFTVLTVVSIALLATIVKLTVRLIVHGAEDENIRKEFEERATHSKKAGAIIDFVVSAVFTCALLVVFCFSIFVNLTEKTYFENIPTFKVVQTGSMSYKHEKNTYLEQNGLHDQFDAFDLIFTYKLPDEMELELYDIVVYEVDDILLVHRIVGIEEPNTRHPNERHFLLQGDAVENPDRFPVLYSQMRGIYRGERIPFAGSFVNFMQSPAGWLCVLLAVTALIATPIIEKHLETAKLERWLLIKGKDGEEEAEEETLPVVAPTQPKAQPIAPMPMPVAATPIAEPVAETTPTEATPVAEEISPVAEEELAPAVAAVQPQEPVADETPVAAVEEIPTEETASSGFGFSGKRDMRTFKQKLAVADESVLQKYRDVVELIARIDKARGQDSRRFESFKRGTAGIARFALRGKTLNIYLGLDPKAFADTKYVFEDVSDVKAFELYPMRMKLTSDRQTRWAKELIERLATEKGWQILEKPDYEDVFEEESEELRLVEVDVEALKASDPFAKLRGKRDTRTFKEKLASADEGVQEKYREITETLTSIERVRTTDSRRFETFKCGNVALARIALRGKTLNVYLGLDPKAYEDTKYIYTDVSDVKAFERYPMRVKVTSARKTKWVKELVAALVKENGLQWKEDDDA